MVNHISKSIAERVTPPAYCRPFVDAQRAILPAEGGVHVTEEADNGSTIGHELMLLADDVASGEVLLATAQKEARDLIETETKPKG